MKAAQIEAFREPLKIVDVAVPAVGAGDALVRVEASGICRTDWQSWQGDFAWINFTAQLPAILGHEFAGTVVEVGADVTRLQAGDRVAVPVVEGCGHCSACRSGASQLCAAMNSPGVTHTGAYAEYVSVPNAEFNCIPLPDSVDAVSAVGLGCRYSVAWNAVTRVGAMRPGQWVTVFGAGGMGLSAVQIITECGGLAIAVDIRDEALGMATKLGAVATINSIKTPDVGAAVQELTSGGAHLSIDCHAKHGTPLQSLMGLRSGGRHVQTGMTSKEDQGMLALPVDVIALREIAYTGCMCTPHASYPALLNLVSQGRLRPADLVTEQIALSDINASLQAMTDYKTLGLHAITSF